MPKRKQPKKEEHSPILELKKLIAETRLNSGMSTITRREEEDIMNRRFKGYRIPTHEMEVVCKDCVTDDELHMMATTNEGGDPITEDEIKHPGGPRTEYVCERCGKQIT